MKLPIFNAILNTAVNVSISSIVSIQVINTEPRTQISSFSSQRYIYLFIADNLLLHKDNFIS